MVDVVLVGFIGAMAFGGLRRGLARTILGLLFVVIAFVASAYLRYPLGWVATRIAPDIPPDYANLVGSTIAFPLVLGGLHVASAAVLKRIRIEGLSKGIDSVLGAAFGFLEAVLIVSAVIVLFDAYYSPDALAFVGTEAGQLKELAKAFNESETVHLLRRTTVPIVVTILGPILPRDLKGVLPKL